MGYAGYVWATRYAGWIYLLGRSPFYFLSEIIPHTLRANVEGKTYNRMVAQQRAGLHTFRVHSDRPLASSPIKAGQKLPTFALISAAVKIISFYTDGLGRGLILIVIPSMLVCVPAEVLAQAGLPPTASASVQVSTPRPDACHQSLSLSSTGNVVLERDNLGFFIIGGRAASGFIWSSDGSRVGGYGGGGAEVHVWDAHIGQEISFSRHANAGLAPGISLAFIGGGRSIISSFAKPDHPYWLAWISLPETGKVAKTERQAIPLITNSHVWTFAYSEKGERLAVISLSGLQRQLTLYALSENMRLRPLRSMELPAYFGSVLVFSRSGAKLAVGSYTGGAMILDGSDLHAWATPDFFPASESESGEVANAITSLAFSPSGRFLAGGPSNINLIRHRPAGLRYGVRDPNLANEPFVSGKVDRPLRIYDLESGRFVTGVPQLLQPLDSIVWVSDNAVIVLDSNARAQAVTCIGSSNAKATDLLDDVDSTLAVSPDGQSVAASVGGVAAVYHQHTIVIKD